MRVKFVTGYVPIPGHPRGREEYDALGAKLLRLDVPKRAFLEDDLETCWMHSRVANRPDLTHAVDDNPRKNTLAYHVVVHQKSEWLRRAAEEDPENDIFVWIDYGVLRLPGVTDAAILDFLGRVDDRGITIPGCWGRGVVDETRPCWRFCGAVVVCPRDQASVFDDAVKREAERLIRERRHVSWEVNTWARVEERGFPIVWYPADHDGTMFTNYPGR